MRIGLDVMGGDHAPGAILDGALAAVEHLEGDDVLVLYGDEAIIETAMEAAGADSTFFEVVATTQAVSMEESPVEAVRAKQDSSLVRMCRDGSRKADRPLDAAISAGSTGAFVAAAQMYMRRLKGVHRPGIAAAVPTPAGVVAFIDVGANIEPKPHHLSQYGVMGSVYSEIVLGVQTPRVALMNVGREEAKGTGELKAARDLLREMAGVDFVGFVEGRSVFDGVADVVVSDGILGNVTIKLAEGLSQGIFKMLAREIGKMDPDLLPRFKTVADAIMAQYDYHEYGGAPLLGVNGNCLICHGSSEARTISNAVRAARQMVVDGLNERIIARLAVCQEVGAS